MSLSIAIIGAGWMGQTHARAVVANGDKIALVIDADEERAKALASEYGAETATELSAAKGLDAAIIATPSFMHLEQATELSRLGVDLLVEKPHRLPNQSPDELANALKSAGTRLQVGMTTRFHEGILALKEGLAEGQLGQILYYTDDYGFHLEPGTLAPWYFDPEFSGGGVVTTNGVHMLDRAAWLLGDQLKIEAVDGLEPLFEDHKIEDYAELRLRTAETGIPVTVSLLWSPYPCPEPELRVIGTKGTARIGLNTYRIDTAGGTRQAEIADPQAGFTRQWADFRAPLVSDEAVSEGPDFDTLETTLKLISAIYKKADK